jgi:hypothetical protein
MKLRSRRASETEAQRPALPWSRTLIVALAALGLAFLAGSQALGMALARFNPPIAVTVAPNNGQALARLAELEMMVAVQQAGGRMPAAAAERSWRDAREAFLKAPLSIRPVRIAALSRDETGEKELARRLMTDLAVLTKRDLVTHLWLIGDAGEQGDLQGLLDHYDLALRTSSRAPELLLPRLATALQVPGAIEQVAQVLAAEPPWANRFWRTLYLTPEALVTGTELRLLLLERGKPVPDDVDRRLILSLARDREWDVAARLYRRVGGDGAPELDRIGQADFKREPQFAPIEWAFPSTGLQFGAIDPELGRMVLSGGPSSTGVAASRVVALEPGRYEVRLEREAAEIGNKATIDVAISCAETAPPPPVARFRGEGGGVQGSFEASAGCRYYSVQLLLDVPRDSVSGQVVVTGVQLRRM